MDAKARMYETLRSIRDSWWTLVPEGPATAINYCSHTTAHRLLRAIEAAIAAAEAESALDPKPAPTGR